MPLIVRVGTTGFKADTCPYTIHTEDGKQKIYHDEYFAEAADPDRVRKNQPNRSYTARNTNMMMIDDRRKKAKKIKNRPSTARTPLYVTPKNMGTAHRLFTVHPPPVATVYTSDRAHRVQSSNFHNWIMTHKKLAAVQGLHYTPTPPPSRPHTVATTRHLTPRQPHTARLASGRDSGRSGRESAESSEKGVSFDSSPMFAGAVPTDVNDANKKARSSSARENHKNGQRPVRLAGYKDILDPHHGWASSHSFTFDPPIYKAQWGFKSLA